jgi:tellurite resistance protein
MKLFQSVVAVVSVVAALSDWACGRRTRRYMRFMEANGGFAKTIFSHRLA